LKSLLESVVRGKDADYVEVRVEESHITRIEFRGRSLEELSQSVSFGGNVRALVDGGRGFVSFNRLDDLEKLVQQAIEQARLVSRVRQEKFRLAPVPRIVKTLPLEVKEDPRRISLDAKKSLLEDYNRQILSYGAEITSSRVSYREKYTKLYFATSEGTWIEQEKLDLAGSLTAIATKGSLTQARSHGFGSSNDFGVVRGLEDKVQEICRIATELLRAPVVTGGTYTVICDPRLAGVFVHEAFGHLSEADNAEDNPRLREIMTLGRRFGESFLNIYDSGDDPGARGYVPFDDEGVPARKTYLIKEGVLVGRLHSRQTAAKMGEDPTGNARALDYRYPPICRMRNTCIEPGDASFEDMLKEIPLGVYAIGSFGGQTNGEMFTFTAAEAYMIRNGQLAELVRDVTLTGNVFHTLRNIDAVGNDFPRHEGAGGCGKGNQGPLPTSMWAPHIRIRNVVIGGGRQ